MQLEKEKIICLDEEGEDIDELDSPLCEDENGKDRDNLSSSKTLVKLSNQEENDGRVVAGVNALHKQGKTSENNGIKPIKKKSRSSNKVSIEELSKQMK